LATDPKNNSQSQGDIDLLFLFTKFGEFIKKAILNLFKFVWAILVFLLQKWYYFGIAIVLAFLSAFLLNKMGTPYFHSNLTLRSNVTHNQPVMSSLDRIGDYAKTKNYSALAEELKLNIEEVSNIKSLETYWFYDLGNDGIIDGMDVEQRFLSDTSIVKIDSVFSVRAEVYDPEMLGKLEEGLLYYLVNNQFLKSLNKQRLSDLEEQLGQINYEIEKLDSLQKREYYTNPDELRQKEGQIVFTSENEVRMYHTQMLNLLHMKQECKRDLNIYSDIVTVLESFTIPIVPDNGTVYAARKLIWYYLGLALLLSLLVTFRKKIWTTNPF
jgi:hypothetical protein